MRGLCGLYVKGFVNNVCVNWLVDTGAARSIVSKRITETFVDNFSSNFDEPCHHIFLADGRKIETCGSGLITLIIGQQVLQAKVLIADISDEAILGMDILIQTNAVVDIVQGTVTINGESIDCVDQENQPLSCRCVIRRSTIIAPSSEVIVYGDLRQRRTDKATTSSDIRIVEPLNNSRLSSKGLFVARTLVQVDNTVPIRIVNLSEEPQTIGANTTIALAKPVDSVQDFELPDVGEEVQESNHDNGELPEPLQEMLKTDLDGEEEMKARELLYKYQHIFSLSDNDVGRCNLIQHKIDTGTEPPIRQPPRRTPPWKQSEIERQVNHLLEKGMIEESTSPWASSVVLVTKKDGSQRLCVDYRQLNKATVQDAFPLPNISDSLDCLSGSQWFSTLDMASGYWQVGMDPSTKYKSAFVTSNGLYEWNVLPFGLSTAPGTFERLMTLVLKGLQFKICLCYLDDIIVFANSFEEHLRRLEEVFMRIESAGLKLKPTKCELFKKETTYLGHVVGEDGVKTDPKKIEKVDNWPVPETPTEVKSFLGLASYYRRFVPGFASIAKPLYQLTENNLKSFEWTASCEEAFEQLKGLLTSAPVLAYPQRDALFILDTDASNHGIGAVLSQLQDGVERPIAYCSRTLSKSERNYCTTRKELLAIVEFAKQQRHYLQNHKFLIRTDHAPLRSILKTKDPEGQLARWIAFLSTLDFDIEYRQGNKHINADAMSRIPCNERCKWCRSYTEPSTVEIGTQTEQGNNPISVAIADGKIEGETTTTCSAVKIEPAWTNEYLREQQLQDATIKDFIKAKESCAERPCWEDVSMKSSAFKALWSQWSRLEVREGVLHRKWENETGDKVTYQLVLPESLRETALHAHHNHTTASHRGIQRTIHALRLRYYWPGLTSQTHRWVRGCHECGAKKNFGKKRRAPLQQYSVGTPMERLAMDILGPLPITPRNNRYVLVVSDYFTKWTEAYALPDQTAATVAETLVSEFVSRFGVPRQIHSDQGTNFESKLMEEVCKLLNIEKTRTTPLHPQSDGQVERFNRTLVEMLRGKLQPDQKDWDLQLPMCMMAYRSAVHESTGFTPNQLMLGREVEVPLDVITQPPPDAPLTPVEYVEALQKRLTQAYEDTRLHLKQAAVRQKRNYDKKLAWKPLQPGDSVWLHNVCRKKGRNPKLDNPWEGPFLVTRNLSDVVYRIQKTARSKPRVVHVDRLKPYLGPPLKSWLLPQNSKSPAPQPQNEPKSKAKETPVTMRQEVVKGATKATQKDEGKGKRKKANQAEGHAEKKETEKSQIKRKKTEKVKGNPQEEKAQADKEQRESEQAQTVSEPKETPRAETRKEQTPADVHGRPKRTVRPPNRLGDWVSTVHAKPISWKD